MSGIINGQDVDQTQSNAAWLAKNGPDTAVGPITLDNGSDPALNDVQVDQNGQNTFMGRPNNNGAATPSWTSTDAGTPSDSLRDRSEALTTKFNAVSGHTHDGSAGSGGPIAGPNITSVPLTGIFRQGTDLASVSGSSWDVSTELTGETPSNGSTQLGVVVNTPYNKVVLRQGSGPDEDDQFVDGSGNQVYGRLTESLGVWTLSFYVNLSGVETAYNFGSAVDMKWFFQQLYAPLVSTPVYSPMATIPSDNPTQDVLDATTTQKGKVLLSSSAAADVGASGSAGTPNGTVATADHVHKGVRSFAKFGDTQLFGDVTLEGIGGVTLTRVGNNIQIAGGGGLAFKQETPPEVPDGIIDTFSLLFTAYSQQSTLVFVDGVEQEVGVAWSLVANDVVFNAGYIPAIAQEIQVFYAVQVGGLGSTVTPKTEYRTLSAGEITAKQITLAFTPDAPAEVCLDVIGGGPQFYTDDFSVSSNILSWAGTPLDGLLIAGDKLRVSYFY
jgi:hypothetical protein